MRFIDREEAARRLSYERCIPVRAPDDDRVLARGNQAAILDGLEVMERKQAHKMLFANLAEIAPAAELQEMESEIKRLLNLPPDQKEAEAEAVFRRLAVLCADQLSRKYPR